MVNEDNRWHFLFDSLLRAYHHIPAGAQVAGLGITVRDTDGQDLNYIVTAVNPGVVHRHLLAGSDAELGQLHDQFVVEIPNDVSGLDGD